MRFLAFTAQFVQSEYDPLSPDLGRLALDVRAEVQRGADTPDYFSTQTGADLQNDSARHPDAAPRKTSEYRRRALRFRKAPRLPRFLLERLIRQGHADRLGGARAQCRPRERRRKSSGPSTPAARSGNASTRSTDGVATGDVVNYDLAFLPGDPEMREVEYPDDNRKYFRKGDHGPAPDLPQRARTGSSTTPSR